MLFFCFKSNLYFASSLISIWYSYFLNHILINHCNPDLIALESVQVGLGVAFSPSFLRYSNHISIISITIIFYSAVEIRMPAAKDEPLMKWPNDHISFRSESFNSGGFLFANTTIQSWPMCSIFSSYVQLITWNIFTSWKKKAVVVIAGFL